MSRLLVPFLFAASACLYDSDNPCAANQVLEDAVCVCAPTAVLDDDGDCVPCGDNEIADAGECVCIDDYVRFTPGGPCEPRPAGDPCPGPNDEFSEGECVCDDGYLRLETDGPCVAVPGDSCSDTDTTCPTPWECYVFDSGSGEGYCTEFDCVTSDDCDAGFACNTDASPTVCERPPVGQGEACEQESDCADYEADYCDTFMTHMCLVQDCVLDPDSCFEGWVCCDMSFVPVPLPNLCLPPENCPN